mmetsp:Transcript_26098/g.55065  ORF Transcript_26098/g.55065 Transcript_26098/m.55065 type:complete len:262 (+) Transcript_26098:184-969(+)
MDEASEPLLLWETWHGWLRGNQRSWQSPVDEIEHMLDSQRRFQSMLADGDIFYSRSDLRLFIDQCREETRVKLLLAYNGQMPTDHNDDIMDVESSGEELVLHAAAKLKVSPLNTMQLLRDYPEFIRQKISTRGQAALQAGSLPLHIAAAAMGNDQVDRLRPLLNAYPDAIRHTDERGMLPLQIALLHGADLDVTKLMTEAFPPSLGYPLLLRPTAVTEDLLPLVGLSPFHMACCCNCSLDVIFQLLASCPGSIFGPGSSLE